MTRDDAFTDAIRTEPELQAAGDALADLPSPVLVSPALKNSVLAAVAKTPQDNVTSIASRRRPTPRFLTIAAACLAIASVGIGATVLWSGSKEESGGNGASISACCTRRITGVGAPEEGWPTHSTREFSSVWPRICITRKGSTWLRWLGCAFMVIPRFDLRQRAERCRSDSDCRRERWC